PLEFTLRSPEQAVRYLGGLVALQNYNKEKFIPTIWPDNIDVNGVSSAAQNLSDGGVPLFRVERGTPQIDAAVSVIDSEANYFYIPRPQYGSKWRDRSLEVLALVQDVLNSAVSKQALPQPTTFALTPVQ